MTAGAPAAPAHAGLVLARGALLAVVAIALPAVGVAAWLHGSAGAAAAGAGLGLVLVLFGAAALLHARAARCSPQGFAALVMAGFGGRLAVYTLALTGLSRLEGLHWPTLVITTALGIACTLAVELWLLARRPELFWVRTDRTVLSEGAER